MQKILVVDDEPSMRDMLEIMLRREDYDVSVAENRAKAANVLASGQMDLVITDLRLPDGDGIEILRHVKAASPETVVIVMTAYGSTETAVAALKLGAHDYLTKPFDIEELKIVIRGALERQRLEQENRLLKAEFHSRHGLDRIIGTSAAIKAVFEMVKAVAGAPSTALLVGESGTGKELVAKAIHTVSLRRDAPFVSVNCGALPDALLESELFGHVKGAFTDAHQNKKGLFEAANHGTLFLDEVSETSPAMQVKLLRVLQEKRLRRVGGTAETPVDVRLIAATNRGLEKLIQEGRFREDLYYRLNVIQIRIPPLRERMDDIPLLAEHFLVQFSGTMSKHVTSIAPQAMKRLLSHSWPGNVRELENVIERAVALETSTEVQVERLPESLMAQAPPPPALEDLPDNFRLGEHMKLTEAKLLRMALERSSGDRREAARLLGVTPRTLRYLVGKHQAGTSRADPADKSRPE